MLFFFYNRILQAPVDKHAHLFTKCYLVICIFSGKPEDEAQKARETQAAIQIQTTFRKFMAKKELEKRKVEKFQYTEQMDKIEREVRNAYNFMQIILEY